MTIAVPDTLDQALSPSWLTTALAPRFPDVRVTSVEPGPVVSRISVNARFRIECDGGTPAGLSPHLCVKGYFNDITSGRAGVPEVVFYRDVAAAAGIRTLRCVYADVDPATQHGVILTEDVVAKGGRFLDSRSEYSPDQVADSLAELAKLHAATWNNPRWANTPWLAPRMSGTVSRRGEPEIQGNFDSPIGAGVPHEMRDARRLVNAYRALAAEVAVAQPWTVVHGDPHVGNLFLDNAGRPSFVDWQLVHRGAWYVDVGYHIASTLTVDDRRRCEQDLVRHYLDHLAGSGIDVPSWDAAWDGIRRGITYGFFHWGITLKVEPAITTELLRRLGTAAADHDALTPLAG